MNESDRRKREEEIFERAMQMVVEADRAAYLDDACYGSPELRARLEALLAAHFKAQGFLDHAPARAASGTEQMGIPDEEEVGAVIGRYKLLEKLGEGGFGAVYVAEQREPVNRRVALKIIKLGMETRQVVARFEAERQALALMDHPNIARVLDGGATETGRPYFVMELVRGMRLTDYCDLNRLPTEQRLDLFTQVCHAIQHAHQKGIIHRDIKPSNILVTVVDGRPVPKVIDFGIAKATQGQLTDKTVYTQLHQFIGTPAYMSPEQAVLSGVDVDTRSDIYSLGVLLYELLTGHTPFDPNTLAVAGLDEMRRIIREKDPPRPSTRISTLDAEERTTVAQQRQAEPAALSRLVRGDLDWIVMKCLEKDRARRYEAASHVALDIQHHLKHEPVTAAAPSAAYRTGKFMRRHKAGLAVAAALAGLFAVGMIGIAWQAIRATRAEKRSAADASRSQQVAFFLRDMLEGVGPSVAKGRDVTLLKEILDKTAERVGRDLTNQPEVEADLRATLGTIYEAVGEYTKAETMQLKALQLRQGVHGDRSLDAAKAMNNLAMVLRLQGRPKEAEAMQREALELRRELDGTEDESLAVALGNLAQVLADQGVKMEEALELQSASTRILREKLDPHDPKVAVALGNLAAMYYRVGRLDQAVQYQKEALAHQKGLQGTNSADYAQSLNNLSVMLNNKGDLAGAEAVIREAVAVRRTVLGSNHAYVATSLGNLASVLWRQSRLEEAEVLQLQALAIFTNQFQANHPEVAGCLNNLATIIHEQGRFAEAEGVHRRVLGIVTNLYGAESRDLTMTLHNLGRVLCDSGRLAEAEELHRAALAMQKKILGPEHPNVPPGSQNLATVLWLMGKLGEAELLLTNSLAARRKLYGELHLEVTHSLYGLALVYRDQKRLAEAETALGEALAGRRKALGNQHPLVANTLEYLALLLLEQDRFAEAEPLARECLTLRQAKSTNNWRTASAQLVLGSALLGLDTFEEAEPLIRSGCEIVNKQVQVATPEGKRRQQDLLAVITRLCQAKGRAAPVPQ